MVSAADPLSKRGQNYSKTYKEQKCVSEIMFQRFIKNTTNLIYNQYKEFVVCHSTAVAHAQFS
jgi:hypothetical protein